MPWVGWLTLAGRAGQRRAAAAERLRLRVAAAAELPVHARAAGHASSTMLVPGGGRRRSRWWPRSAAT
ncbi:MAG: hypothetical protein MZW92_34695 [Comamonadaceae bacterium]|nr:hypothetical protein [Comamonadaceae bacterium]